MVLDDAGPVANVMPRPRLDSHRLIEEFMVLANVAAAEELERLRQPCMYRVACHRRPRKSSSRCVTFWQHSVSLCRPATRCIRATSTACYSASPARRKRQVVNEVMLRSQSQAAYSPDNIGHFGLALPRYAHFTSPIRRYADLLVHRALIKGLKLGRDGLAAEEIAAFPETAERITETERRAQQAERDAIDRYLSAFMSDKSALVSSRAYQG